MLLVVFSWCAGKAVAAPSSLCPRRWAHSLLCLWIHVGMGMPSPTARSAPCWLSVSKCCLTPWLLLLQGMGVTQWCSGLHVLPSWGFLGSSARGSPKKSWQGLALEKCLALFFPPSNFLLPGVQAHPGQPGGKPQFKKWRINRFSALCQSIKCWETRPCTLH